MIHVFPPNEMRQVINLAGSTRCKVILLVGTESEATPLRSVIPPLIAAIERPRESLMTYHVLKSIAASFVFPVVFPVPYFRYNAPRYRFFPV